MTNKIFFEISNLGYWSLFIVWPACAKAGAWNLVLKQMKRPISQIFLRL
jgi:hypothetical protein